MFFTVGPFMYQNTDGIKLIILVEFEINILGKNHFKCFEILNPTCICKQLKVYLHFYIHFSKVKQKS